MSGWEVVVISIAGSFGQCREAVAQGRVACPGCGSPLSRRGFAPPLAAVRGAGRVAGLGPGGERIRTWCAHCRRGHTLLPAELAAHRADTAAVLVAAVTAHADHGLPAARIAAALGRPARTVSGWLAQARAFAAAHLPAFTALLGAFGAGETPGPVVPSGDLLREFAGVLRALARSAACRWGDLHLDVPGRINLICQGRFISGSLRMPVYPGPAAPPSA